MYRRFWRGTNNCHNIRPISNIIKALLNITNAFCYDKEICCLKIHKILEQLKIGEDWWRLVEIGGDPSRSVEIGGDLWENLEASRISNDCIQLLFGLCNNFFTNFTYLCFWLVARFCET